MLFFLLFPSCLMLLLLLFVYFLLLFFFFCPSPFCRLSVDHYYQIPKLSKTMAKNVIFPKPSRPKKKVHQFSSSFPVFFKDALYPAQIRTLMTHTQKHIHKQLKQRYTVHITTNTISYAHKPVNTKINLQPVVESLSACLGFFTDTISTSESSRSLSATNTSVSIISQVQLVQSKTTSKQIKNTRIPHPPPTKKNKKMKWLKFLCMHDAMIFHARPLNAKNGKSTKASGEVFVCLLGFLHTVCISITDRHFLNIWFWVITAVNWWQNKQLVGSWLSPFIQWRKLFIRVKIHYWPFIKNKIHGQKLLIICKNWLGNSGGVNSPDFCLASLKSLGCFYFQHVLSSQRKTVNLRILHCQLLEAFLEPRNQNVSGNKQ